MNITKNKFNVSKILVTLHMGLPKRSVVRLLAILFFITICSLAAADGFLQLPGAGMTVYEPGQKAILGWNGTREVMILSTDVYASEPVWALELIPFPSLPENPVAGSFDSFATIEDIINSRGYRPEGGDVNDDGRVDILDALLVAQYYVEIHVFLPHLAGGDVNVDNTVDIIDALIIAQYYVGLYPPSWNHDYKGGRNTIVFSERIGVHNITIVKVTDAAELINFARELLLQKEPEIDVTWEKLQTIAEAYLAEGMEYWVLDLLELGVTEKSREPVIYTFNTDRMYFPLKISSATDGLSVISLFTFSQEPLTLDIPNWSFDSPIWPRYSVSPIYVTQEELEVIDPGLSSLFSEEQIKLGFYQFGGSLHNLNVDFFAY